MLQQAKDDAAKAAEDKDELKDEEMKDISETSLINDSKLDSTMLLPPSANASALHELSVLSAIDKTEIEYPSDLESEGTALEEDEDAGVTSEEAQKKLEKVLEESFQAKQELQKSLNSLRAKHYGQDRHWRRYWYLPKCGGIFVEGMESAQYEIFKYHGQLEERFDSKKSPDLDEEAKEKDDIKEDDSEKSAEEKMELDLKKQVKSKPGRKEFFDGDSMSTMSTNSQDGDEGRNRFVVNNDDSQSVVTVESSEDHPPKSDNHHPNQQQDQKNNHDDFDIEDSIPQVRFICNCYSKEYN